MRSLNRRSFFRAGAGIAGAFGIESLFAAVQDKSTPYQRPKLKITDVKSANLVGLAGGFGIDSVLAGVQDSSTPYQGLKGEVADVKAHEVGGLYVRDFQ